MGALLDAWLEHIVHLGRSPTTLWGYRRLIDQLPPGFAAWPLGKVTPKLVDDLYVHIGTVGRRKPATVLRFHAVLRAAFAQTKRWGWIERSPSTSDAAPTRATSVAIRRPFAHSRTCPRRSTHPQPLAASSSLSAGGDFEGAQARAVHHRLQLVHRAIPVLEVPVEEGQRGAGDEIRRLALPVYG